MRTVYPNDISREKFEIISPDLESCGKNKIKKLDLYDIFCGVLYALKSVYQWRMIPKEFPRWRNCYDYFKKWSKKTNEDRESVLEIVLKKLVGENSGRNTKTSFCIIDAKSVKNTDTAEEKGYDAGKKISVIKCHIAVDTQGLTHAIHKTCCKREGMVIK
nr:transposase [Wolbachia endosymbiont of Bemisia tabaci]